MATMARAHMTKASTRHRTVFFFLPVSFSSICARAAFNAAAEGFFHGLTLGFLATLRKRFRVLSNVESGEGRFDIALKPLVEPFPAFIIEVKAADSAADDLKALARDARAQIDGKKYDTSFRAEGITDIEKIGLAYFKDRVEICKKVNDGK